MISDARLTGRNTSTVVERLLAISGEDTITVNRKYRDQWTGKLPSRFMVISNELPHFGDASGAIVGRFVVLLLTRSWLGDEDPDLEPALHAELPEILNWALDGLDRLREQGRFTRPPSTDEAVIALMDLASPVAAFVRDRCARGLDAEVAVRRPVRRRGRRGPRTTATSPAPRSGSAATCAPSSPGCASSAPVTATPGSASTAASLSVGPTMRRTAFHCVPTGAWHAMEHGPRHCGLNPTHSRIRDYRWIRSSCIATLLVAVGQCAHERDTAPGRRRGVDRRRPRRPDPVARGALARPGRRGPTRASDRPPCSRVRQRRPAGYPAAPC